MIKPQEQIDIEVDAIKVLSALLQFNDGLVWTNRMIRKVANLETVELAIIFLQKNGYLSNRHGEYFITVDGRQYFDDSVKNATVGKPSDAYEFRNEVLTGLDKFGEKTAIINGTLPSTCSYQRNVPDPEQILGKIELADKIKAKLMSDYDLSEEKWCEFLADGRVRICKKCEKIGVFDRNGKNRWMHMCRKCRKSQ